MSDDSTKIIDAEGHIAGRLCSQISKLLLNGNRVIVVNAEKALISGGKKSIIRENDERLEIRSSTHPKHGPFHPRKPDNYLSKMVRGMLPRNKPSGRAAQKRLRVYVSIPKEYQNSDKITFQNLKATKHFNFYTSLEELSSTMGWRNVE